MAFDYGINIYISSYLGMRIQFKLENIHYFSLGRQLPIAKWQARRFLMSEWEIHKTNISI